MPHPPKYPLVAVIGATGTGKSKLAVELATRFNGEIINGDAMQMYKGLPIITNKIPEQERNGIPHHLLDHIDLGEKPWTVTQFVKNGTRIVDEVRSRGKLPIVVGGTHYYTHALLFKDATLINDRDESESDHEQKVSSEEEFPLLSKSTEEILLKLQEVDPEMARRWHPKERRKIQKSLEIWLKTGKKASEIYAVQGERRLRARHQIIDDISDPVDREDSSVDPAGLRYSTLLFWLEADRSVLKSRLDARVDAMLASGLADEALALSKLETDLIQRGVLVDKSMGIWVSIGYKEMEPWVQEQQTVNIDASKSSRALQETIDSIKAHTRQYANRQNRYIRIRLANALNAANSLDRLFLLDCSALRQWDRAVMGPAERITGSFLNGDDLPNPTSLSDLAARVLSEIGERGIETDRQARTCETCDKTLMTEKEWQVHLSSRGHKKAVAARRKREPQQAGVAEHCKARSPTTSAA
ncbi:tRNA dimethylallyltransferase [Rhinocladiella mackenziei CBS 650.93]|uniref:tRNA dimethylallyltransferase n=1 Tax=Rhinocladiella mackenziei CBS 650.93 TaxID=1442369 RepID=A0A0D2J0D7_9EURO|nr:tRNA dimethylallyltransferase [Rhinocladiella mackenziei CBS 650.93]KIX09101.1 tRNA dimethylallyltransferase [Rhinocladiella mackenziei CBS 650.93]